MSKEYKYVSKDQALKEIIENDFFSTEFKLDLVEGLANLSDEDWGDLNDLADDIVSGLFNLERVSEENKEESIEPPVKQKEEESDIIDPYEEESDIIEPDREKGYKDFDESKLKGLYFSRGLGVSYVVEEVLYSTISVPEGLFDIQYYLNTNLKLWDSDELASKLSSVLITHSGLLQEKNIGVRFNYGGKTVDGTLQIKRVEK